MIKRLFDFTVSLIAIIFLSPIMATFGFLIWIQDWHSPFFISLRVGKNNVLFKMVKFRSMIINAESSGVDSTSSSDLRITPLGKLIRRYKIDELPNFFNILLGDMSFVGPRPNVKRETDLYTEKEKKLLSVTPGITDFASIVFSDEGDILDGSEDPDLDYNQLIRPWKSRLGLFYVEKKNLILDIYLILLTFLSIFSKQRSLTFINYILKDNNASDQLINISLRVNSLKPFPPPGSSSIVKSRKRTSSKK
jgi:lipopolysaccharide/colanic/teichoic acid biosynthesis glycosyltransferase